MSSVSALAGDRRRFSLAELVRMVRVGILDEDERLELIDGELVAMSQGGRDYAPMPDVAVLRPLRYVRTYPAPGNVLLVVEVADTSQARDRAKMRLYGQAGIREGWVVDLETKAVHVYRSPGPDGYRRVHRIARPRVLTILYLDTSALGRFRAPPFTAAATPGAGEPRPRLAARHRST
jgi:hypothetical protein